jgi:chromosome segregation ATPase
LAEFYHDQIETLQEKLEAATYRNGYLEAQLSSAESQLKLLPDLSAKATTTETLEQQIAKLESELALAQSSWWVRFGRWFLGKK